jgi:hypothetical protein
MAQHAQPLLFDDMEATTGYATEARSALTQWVMAHRRALGGIHILTHNRLVAMGVTVANLALGGFLTAYTDRTAFNAALGRVVSGRTGTTATTR